MKTYIKSFYFSFLGTLVFSTISSCFSSNHIPDESFEGEGFSREQSVSKLPEFNNLFSSESIISPLRIGSEEDWNADNRKKVPYLEYPYRSSLSLRINFGDSSETYVGTATMIGENFALTAAHNLFHVEKKIPASKITYFAGLERFSAKEAGQVKGYAFSTIFRENEFRGDYGLLYLGGELGRRTGYAALTITEKIFKEQVSPPIEIAGFPFYVGHEGAKTETKGSYLYGDKGHIIPSDKLDAYKHEVSRFSPTENLFYTIHTTGGQSGSAVFYKKNDQTYSTGVHVRGGFSLNKGTAITLEVYNNILTWADHLANQQEIGIVQEGADFINLLKR